MARKYVTHEEAQTSGSREDRQRQLEQAVRVGQQGRDEAWHVVGATGEPAFQNAWVNTGVAGDGSTRFKRIGNVVYVQCWVKGGAAGVAAYTLPVGYRPAARIAIKGTNGVADLLCFVESNGDVIVSSSAVGGDGNCRFVGVFPADQ